MDCNINTREWEDWIPKGADWLYHFGPFLFMVFLVVVGGAAAGIDRLTVTREAYPGISLAFTKIYKDDGIGGFYAGISPTRIGMLPYSSCYYFMYDTLKKTYCQAKEKKSLNRSEMLLVGALSGFTASTHNFPLEIARDRLMVGVPARKVSNPHGCSLVGGHLGGGPDGSLLRVGR